MLPRGRRSSIALSAVLGIALCALQPLANHLDTKVRECLTFFLFCGRFPLGGFLIGYFVPKGLPAASVVTAVIVFATSIPAINDPGATSVGASMALPGALFIASSTLVGESLGACWKRHRQRDVEGPA